MNDNKNTSLADLEHIWDAGATKAREFEDAPDGRYNVKIMRCEVKTAKESGNRYINWGLQIQGGQHNNKWIWKKSLLNSPENMAYFRRDLEKLGVKLEKIGDFNPEVFLDAEVNVEKVTKPSRKGDPFININFIGSPAAAKPEKEDASF